VSAIRHLKARADRIPIPKVAVVTLCALLLALPAGLALGHDLRIVPWMGWAHHHTPDYTTCNDVNQSDLWQSAFADAKADWRDDTVLEFTAQSNCHPGDGERVHLEFQDGNYGNTGWRVLETPDPGGYPNPYHAQHTHIQVNLDAGWSGYAQYDRRAMACRSMGETIGVKKVSSPQLAAEGPNNDCMSFQGVPADQVSRDESQNNYTYTAGPGAHSTDLLDAHYDQEKPNVQLSGSLKSAADNAESLTATEYELLVDVPAGTDLVSSPAHIAISVDGDVDQELDQACTCAAHVVWSFKPSDWPGGQHTVSVTAQDTGGFETTRVLTASVPGGLGTGGEEEEVLDASDPAAEVGGPVPLSGGAPSPIAMRTPNPQAVAAGQAAAEATTEYQESAQGGSGGVAAGTSNGLIADGLDGVGSGGDPPADASGAIGQSRYVEAVNSRIAVYRRSDLSQVSSKALASFVGAAGEDVGVPQIIWDEAGQRWYYSANRQRGSTNFLAFGWSKYPDPSDLGAWCNFFLKTGTRIEDYPRLGQNKRHLLIGTNVYESGTTFQTARVRAIPKPKQDQTACKKPQSFRWGSEAAPLRESDGDLAFTPAPANTVDNSSRGYVVSADNFNTRDQLNIWHVSGAKSSPQLASDAQVSVAQYAFPPKIPQPGTNNRIYALDTRLSQAVASADPDAAGEEAVWTQHTVTSPGGGIAEVRWYELIPTASGAELRQSGLQSDPEHHVFNGAISPGSDGQSAVLHYLVGSGARLPTLEASSRIGTTALGQMASAETIDESLSALEDPLSCNPLLTCRLGDYASASPDPQASQVVWGSSELVGPASSIPQWETRNFSIDAGQ
jgi:hypothetical protein